MWVLTEGGELVNLDRCCLVRPDKAYASYDSESNVNRLRPVVKAYEPGPDAGSFVLCSCEDEEHGKRIVRHIATSIANTDRNGALVWDFETRRRL